MSDFMGPCPHRVIGKPCPSCQEKNKKDNIKNKRVESIAEFFDKKNPRGKTEKEDDSIYDPYDYDDYYGWPGMRDDLTDEQMKKINTIFFINHDTPNQNNRIYPKETFEKALKEFADQIPDINIKQKDKTAISVGYKISEKDFKLLKDINFVDFSVTSSPEKCAEIKKFPDPDVVKKMIEDKFIKPDLFTGTPHKSEED